MTATTTRETPVHRLAANLEWLFAEAGPGAAERVRAAAAAGLDAVEVWGWRDKDLDALGAALQETGVELLTMVVDPQLRITDPATHERYLRGVEESLAAARRLRCPHLVVAAGNAVPGRSRDEQRAAVTDVLARAAGLLAGSGVTLLLEPLNSRVDHVGTFLDSTAQGLAIVRDVASPHLRLLLDAYHALVMGEDLRAELVGSTDLVGHVQVADVPGRHEPGTGAVDWAGVLTVLDDLGYRGAYGLEYRPTVGTTTSLQAIEQIARTP